MPDPLLYATLWRGIFLGMAIGVVVGGLIIRADGWRAGRWVIVSASVLFVALLLSVRYLVGA